MTSTVTQTKLLPLPIPGTDYVLEPVDGRFVTDRGKTWLQMLYQDSISLVSPQVLPSMPVRRLWGYLKDGNPDPKLFYSQELHKPYGVEAGDLSPVLKQLAEEMKSHYLFTKGAFAVDNSEGLVLNLGTTQLPAFIEPGVYTATPVTPSDRKHGMSLEEFKEAGGRIVAYRAFPAIQLKHDEWTKVSQAIEPLGVMPGDEIYANLDSRHSGGVKALGWGLFRSVGRPSVLDAGVGLDDWGPSGGALRGRRLTPPWVIQERIRETVNQLEIITRQLQNIQ